MTSQQEQDQLGKKKSHEEESVTKYLNKYTSHKKRNQSAWPIVTLKDSFFIFTKQWVWDVGFEIQLN